MTSSIVKTTAPNLAKRASPAERAKQILDTWFDRYSPRTVEVYRSAFDAFGRWVLRNGDLPADTTDALLAGRTAAWLFSLDAAEAHVHVQAFVKYLGARGLAPNSIGIHLSAVRSLVKLGRVLGAITWTLEVRGPKPQTVRDTRGPDADGARKLLESTRGNACNHAMVRLMLELGLRGIELRELQEKHLHLSDRPPNIMVRGKGQTGLKPITVSTQVRVAIEEYLAERPTESLHPESFLFYAKDYATQLSKTALSNRISRIGKAAGIRVWPHALRHSAITMALDATGGDVRKVQKFSRHAHLETLVRYDDQRRDVAAEVSAQVNSMLEEK